jgi:leader peptidase (prepilin peptidase) / N-methyltransferase
MNTAVYVVVAWFGLAIGSFLNVVIYRLPRKMGLVLERSKCPSCGTQLRWYHNIPLLSFAILRGKCGFCKKPISRRYPLVESITALLYVYFYHQFGMSSNFAVFAFLATLLIPIFFIDLDFQIIPDALTIPAMVIGLLYSLLPQGIGLVSSVIGLVVGGGALYLIALLGDFLFKKESMGGGDIKMAAMLGSFLGWQKVLLVFMSSAVFGLIISAIAMVFSARLRKERVIPFGPFLALGALLAITYGDRIVRFYVDNILKLH